MQKQECSYRLVCYHYCITKLTETCAGLSWLLRLNDELEVKRTLFDCYLSASCDSILLYTNRG